MGVNGIYGLSGSGLDIESMVKAGMVSKQNEYDRMYKKEVSNTWTKEAYNGVYNDLFKYKNTTLYDYKMQSFMNAMSAKSSNESLVTATANGAAGSMTHKVKVESLATNAYLMTKDTVQREGTTEGSIYLRDLMFGSIEDNGDGTYKIGRDANHKTVDTITYGGTDYEKIEYDKAADKYKLTAGDDTIELSAEEIKSATFKFGEREIDGKDVTINKDSAGKITSFYTPLQYDAESVNATDIAVSFKIGDGDGYTTVSYTYKDLLEGGGKTLYDLATDASKDVNITAKYDSATDSFSLYNSKGGEENTISLSVLTAGQNSSATAESAANTASLFNHLHLAQSDGETLGDIQTYTAGETNTITGENGKVIIDGKEYSNLTGNKTTVAGVTYTFNDITVGETVSISVSQDTDTIIERVQQFVDDYNEILDMLNEKYSEEKYSDYQPLTKAQEEAMTETQIDKWNEKAKSGLLYHDNNIRQIISEMREAIYTPIDSINSKYNCASAIGISSSNSKGHLTLDTDKLKEALANDPDCVSNIFTTYEEEQERVVDPKTQAVSYKTTGKNVFSGTGLAWRLNDVMTKSISTVSDYAGTMADVNDESYLGKLITNLQAKMSNFKTMMDAYEDQLFKKYDGLESAIMKLSMQLSTVTGGNQ